MGGCVSIKPKPPPRPSIPQPRPPSPVLIPHDKNPLQQAKQQYEKYYVRLEFTIDKTPSHGTGFIFHITDEEVFVLTCLHNLKSLSEGDEISGSKPYQDLKAFIQGVKHPVLTLEQVHHPENLDIAILKLKYSYKVDPPQIHRHTLTKEEAQNCQVMIIGCQTDGSLEESDICKDLSVQKIRERSSEFLSLFYSCSTTAGFSGAPILVLMGEEVKIVGVHTHDNMARRQRGGVALTSSIEQWLKTQIQPSNNSNQSEQYTKVKAEIDGESNILDLSRYTKRVDEDELREILSKSTKKGSIRIIKAECEISCGIRETLMIYTAVEELNLSNNGLNNAEFRLLLMSLPNLKAVTLLKSKITMEAFPDLQADVSERRFRNLRSLRLDPIYDKSKELLLLEAVIFLASLEELTIGYPYSKMNQNRLHTTACLRLLEMEIQEKSKLYAVALPNSLEYQDLKMLLFRLYIMQQNCLYVQVSIRANDAHLSSSDKSEQQIIIEEKSRIEKLRDSMASRLGNVEPRKLVEECVRNCSPVCLK